MLQSTIILNLLEQLAAESDPAKRADLMRAAERQYYLDMEHQSNFVQSRIGARMVAVDQPARTQALAAQHVANAAWAGVQALDGRVDALEE